MRMDAQLARTLCRPALPRPRRRGRHARRHARPGGGGRCRDARPGAGHRDGPAPAASPLRRRLGRGDDGCRCGQPGAGCWRARRPRRASSFRLDHLAPGAHLPAALVPLALNAALLAAEALPRGGTVQLSRLRRRPGWSSAPRAATPPGRPGCWRCSAAARPRPRCRSGPRRVLAPLLLGPGGGGGLGASRWPRARSRGAAAAAAAPAERRGVYRIFALRRAILGATPCARSGRAKRGTRMDDLLADFLTETNRGAGRARCRAGAAGTGAGGRRDPLRGLPHRPHRQGHLRLPRPAAAGTRWPMRRRTCSAATATARGRSPSRASR